MKSLSKQEIQQRYQQAALADEDYAKARWGSYDSMMNRFRAAMGMINFQTVTRWLDLGSGVGVFQSLVAEHLAAEQFQIPDMVAVDLIPDLLVAAVTKARQGGYKLQTVEADVEFLPFDCEQFDLVTAIGLLHCCGADYRTVIGEMARCLEPTGQFLITTMHHDWNGFMLPNNSRNGAHAWFRVPDLKEAFAAHSLDPLVIKGLMPRTGVLGEPEEGYCLVVWGRKQPYE